MTTRAEDRRLKLALDFMDEHAFRAAYLVVGRILRIPERELAELAAQIPELPRAEIIPAKDAPPPPTPARSTRPMAPQPKGISRIVAPETLRQFTREHEVCVLLCCDQRADAHHIWPRGLQGPDYAWNLLPLCVDHHTGLFGWHSLSPEPDAFLAHFADRIPPYWMKRIAAARAMQTAFTKGTLTTLPGDEEGADGAATDCG